MNEGAVAPPTLRLRRPRPALAWVRAHALGDYDTLLAQGPPNTGSALQYCTRRRDDGICSSSERELKHTYL